MPADEPRSEDAPEFRSPKRALALSFRLSRDRWKAKATRRLQEIKAFRVRVRDLQASRDLWKEKAFHLQRQVQDLLGLPPAERQADQAPASLGPAVAPAPLAGPHPPAQAAVTAAPDQPPPPEPPVAAAPTGGAKKKTAPAGGVIREAAPAARAVPGQHYELDRIWLCLSCLLAGKVPLRAVPRLLEVFDSCYPPDQPGAIPDWTTSRMWLMRLGLAQMRQPVVKADDWVWLLDHSVQLGRDRCLAVLGGRLSEMPCGPLRRCDLRLLHLAVMRDPNMNSNHQQMLRVLERTGPPRAVLSDHGADVLGAVRLLRQGPGQANGLDIYDIKHRAALALKERLEDAPRWAEFLSAVGQARNAAKQTEWAFLLPPVLRSKSRYLNLGELVRWAERTSWLLLHKPKALLEHGAVVRLEQKLGWLLGFGGELEAWRGWYQVAARAEQGVRNRGLYSGVEQDLRKRLEPVAKDGPGRQMAAELVAFVADQSKGLRPGERVPGSTEVLESCLGTLKALEKDQSRSGFTALVLGLGALLGKVSKEVVRQALASTPIKAVRRWCQKNIGESLQSKRGHIYRLARVTDLG